MTFIATVNAILYAGATPILADIDGQTYNIDPTQIRQKITSRTKAIIPVHFAGHPCEMDEIMEIADRYKLYVIEDAAHAVGADYKGERIGSIGDITCFSFYATKGMTTGEGGMITTKWEDLHRKMEMLSLHGMDTDAWKRYSPDGKVRWEIEALGYKYNMTDLQASLGIHQLRKLNGFIEKRSTLAECYNKELMKCKAVAIPTRRWNITHSWYIYPILFNPLCPDKFNRFDLADSLRNMGIGTGVHFIAVYKQPYYARFGWPGNYPMSSYVSDRILSLPLFTKMTEEDVKRVCNTLKAVIHNNQGGVYCAECDSHCK